MKTTAFLFLLLTAVCGNAQTVQEHVDNYKKAFEAEDYQKALKHIDEALKLEPESYRWMDHRAEVLFALDRFEESLKELNKAVELHPQVPQVYGNRAKFYASVNQFERAIADYAAAMSHATNDSLMCTYLTLSSGLKLRTREFESAYKDLLEAYALDSNRVEMLLNLGKACSSLGKPDEALKYAFRITELDPDFAMVYSNIGFVYQKQGEHAKAIEFFDKNIEKDPESAFGYNNRAYSKLQLDDLKGAMADVETSLKLMPSNAYAYRNRALIWIAMGKTKKACEDLQTAIDKGFLEQYGPEAAELQSKHCR